MVRRVAGYLAGVMAGMSLLACGVAAGPVSEPVSLPLIENWSGTYPVAELGRLPEGQRENPVGFIADAPTFAAVWEALMPEKPLPAVDFSENLVVFSRNVQFFNRTSIMRVNLDDGRVEVLAMETMSAMPIEDRVAMALAVIPRSGVRSIRVDNDTTLPVR